MDDKVVVGSGSSSWFHRVFKWQNIVTVLIIIVVATAAGFGARWLQNRKPTPVKEKGRVSTAASAQSAALSGHPDAAHKQIDEALKNPSLTNEEKYQLNYQQGAIYQNQGNYQAALDSYKKAAAAKSIYSVYESMGEVVALLGDKQAAIDYYKKAISLIPSDHPIGEQYKLDDQQKIRDLGGQP